MVCCFPFFLFCRGFCVTTQQSLSLSQCLPMYNVSMSKNATERSGRWIIHNLTSYGTPCSDNKLSARKLSALSLFTYQGAGQFLSFLLLLLFRLSIEMQTFSFFSSIRIYEDDNTGIPFTIRINFIIVKNERELSCYFFLFFFSFFWGDSYAFIFADISQTIYDIHLKAIQ